MGTNICGVFQARIDGQWIDIPSNYREDRDYPLYHWLAGVGVSDVEPIAEYRGLPPDFQAYEYGGHLITNPGMLIPNVAGQTLDHRDFNMDECWRGSKSIDHPEWGHITQFDSAAGRAYGVFMGEWGFSWLLGSEIVNAPAPKERLKINIPIDTYKQWDKTGNPPVWTKVHSSDLQNLEADTCYTSTFRELATQPATGHVIVHRNFATPENITPATDYVIVDWDYDYTEDFKYFTDEVKRLIALYGEIRFVFGFC